MKNKGAVLLLAGLLFSGCAADADEGVFTGILEGTVVQVPALTGGRITRILVDTGEQVRKDQVLAIIDSSELHLQTVQLKAAMLEIEAQRKLTDTSVKRSKNELQYVRTRYKRVKDLVAKNSAPQQNLDDAANRLQNAEAAFQGARQQLFVLQAKQKQLEAKLALVSKHINDTVIKAPMQGIVSSRYFEEGEAVPPMGQLLEIIKPDPVETKIYIPETRLGIVKVGQTVHVEIDGSDRSFEGRIIWISAEAEFTPKNILTEDTRTSLVYAVKIRISNPDGVLKHGMPVVVRF